MHLYVVRHADAVSIGNGISSDFDRTLSDRGRSDAMLMAKLLAQVDIDVGAILTSPLVRAVETGEIFGEELKRASVASKRLEPGFVPRQLTDEIFTQYNGANVVTIGHQPDMSILISYLVSPAQAASVSMETCAIACVEVQRTGPGHLRWLLTPEVARRICPV